MPQIYTHTCNPATKLAVWQLTEPESFFIAAAAGAKEIAHPHKRLQHLCSRYLLMQLAPGILPANIIVNPYNKPFLPGHPYHFSVSHTDDFVAAVVSTAGQAGIDVETFGQRVLRIRHKFLTPAEEQLLEQDCRQLTEVQRLTLAWSAKETMFKWLGQQGVDFKSDLHLLKINPAGSGGLIVVKICRSTVQELLIFYKIFDDFVLTWLPS